MERSDNAVIFKSLIACGLFVRFGARRAMPLQIRVSEIVGT